MRGTTHHNSFSYSLFENKIARNFIDGTPDFPLGNILLPVLEDLSPCDQKASLKRLDHDTCLMNT